MKSRNIVISIVSGAVLTVVLLAIALSCIMGALSQKKRELENIYEGAFYAFCNDIDLLETDLSKLVVSHEGRESVGIINNAKTHALGAVDAYLCLPIDYSSENEGAVKFLNQVVDWCDSCLLMVAKGEKTHNKETAKKLYDCTREIAYNLNEMSSQGKLALHTDKTLLSSSMVDINNVNKFDLEYPTLIYDGPFSDREEVKSKAIENKKKIDQAQAIKIANTSLDMQNVNVVGKSEGHTVCYELAGDIEGNEAYALITQKGGYVSLFLCNYQAGESEAVLSGEACEKKAKIMLESLGYHNMQVVWKNENEEEICFNFAPVIKDITYYTDLVKVRVARKGGRVEGIESSGYISSFTNRNYAPKIDKQTARNNVDLDEIDGVRLCVIPLLNSERLCYEVNGKYEQEKYYIYIDAQNGEQVEIKKVIGSNQGEVVM